MNVTVTPYSIETGLFESGCLNAPQEQLDINIRDGFSCLIGAYDHLSQKVDLETGFVIDYIPPQPSENHIWDETTKRWVYQNSDEDLARKAKLLRSELLAETDWLSIRAYDGIEMPDAWKTYRQALRDITKQEGFPTTIEWPSKPV